MPLIALNKKAYHDYEVLETYEAGLVLTGPEVKAIKLGQVNLTSGYVTIDKNEEVWLNNIYVSPYPPAALAQRDYNPKPSRKLLLKKSEISRLVGKTQIKGYTFIPLKIYTKNSLIKIEVGLARGKKKWDKKEEIKKREIEKNIREAMKSRI